MTLIEKNTLKSIFIDIMKSTGAFTYEDGSPFMINYKGNDIFVYVKNITSAYFRNLPDITRVQLPFRPHYERITHSKIPFIILGYDQKNDVFVNWNPVYIKSRLNAKSNVSLYSKQSLQQNAGEGGILENLNVNGEKQVYFKSQYLPLFFDSFDSIYQLDGNCDPDITSTNQKPSLPKELLEKILPLIEKGNILKAIEICSRNRPEDIKDMGFKDWFLLLNPLFDTKEV